MPHWNQDLTASIQATRAARIQNSPARRPAILSIAPYRNSEATGVQSWLNNATILYKTLRTHALQPAVEPIEVAGEHVDLELRLEYQMSLARIHGEFGRDACFSQPYV
jgi:hypothetical protein